MQGSETASENGMSCSRRKDLWGKKLNMKDGVYVLQKGGKQEHIVSVKSGYVDNGDEPAVLYKRDRHTEYWVRGWPQTRSDGSPAILSDFGRTAEYWDGGKFERIVESKKEVH